MSNRRAKATLPRGSTWCNQLINEFQPGENLAEAARRARRLADSIAGLLVSGEACYVSAHALSFRQRPGSGPAMTKIGRREVLRGVIAVLPSAAMASIGVLAGCGSSTTAGGPTSPSAPSPPAPPPDGGQAGAPRLGGHALAFNFDGTPVAPLATPPMTTAETGSTLLVCVGRGVVSTHARPRDNKGNNYTQLGST